MRCCLYRYLGSRMFDGGCAESWHIFDVYNILRKWVRTVTERCVTFFIGDSLLSQTFRGARDMLSIFISLQIRPQRRVLNATLEHVWVGNLRCDRQDGQIHIFRRSPSVLKYIVMYLIYLFIDFNTLKVSRSYRDESISTGTRKRLFVSANYNQCLAKHA